MNTYRRCPYNRTTNSISYLIQGAGDEKTAVRMVPIRPTAEIAMLISPHLPYIPERADRILEAYRTDRPKDKGESLTDE